MMSLELQPMVPSVVPTTLTFDVLACGDNSCSPDHGHQITLTTNLDTQDTESTLLTVESDSLHRPLQWFDWCLPVSRVLGATYHLPQPGSVFCEAALFILLTAAAGTGIIAPHLLACTKTRGMQTCTVGPAKTAKQFVV